MLKPESAGSEMESTNALTSELVSRITKYSCSTCCPTEGGPCVLDILKSFPTLPFYLGANTFDSILNQRYDMDSLSCQDICKGVMALEMFEPISLLSAYIKGAVTFNFLLRKLKEKTRTGDRSTGSLFVSLYLEQLN